MIERAPLTAIQKAFYSGSSKEIGLDSESAMREESECMFVQCVASLGAGSSSNSRCKQHNKRANLPL